MGVERQSALKRTSASPMLNIRSLEHLAMRLGVHLRMLKLLARDVVWFYNPTRLRAKKGGGEGRPIDAPRPRLKVVQRRINKSLLADLWLPDSVHAYRVGRSIKTATEPHKGRPFLWVADIRGFYSSISYRAVYAMFFGGLGCSPDVARLLTILTTHKHRLPQGAPTSPALANLYLRLSGAANRLLILSERHDFRVTFFGDDILISGDRPFMGLTPHFAQIIESCGLQLNRKKTLPVAGPNEKHQALGVVMKSFDCEIDAPRTYRRRLRSLIHLVERYGPGALREFGITNKDPRQYLEGKVVFAVYLNPKNTIFEERLKRIAW